MILPLQSANELHDLEEHHNQEQILDRYGNKAWVHVVSQDCLTHLAVGYNNHVFFSSFKSGGSPVNLNYLPNNMGFPSF